VSIKVLGVAQAIAKLASIQALGKIAGEAAEKAVAEDVANLAQSMVAVDTGATRDSIQETEEGVVASEAGLYLEFGTFKMAAQPFMRPAADSASEGPAALAASSVFGRL
jgi:HK97 gp10 family phage protein